MLQGNEEIIEAKKHIIEVARELHENIKLDNIIERLCLHLDSFSNNDILNDKYYKFVRIMTPEYPVSGMVCYINGRPAPKEFRKYHIKSYRYETS